MIGSRRPRRGPDGGIALVSVMVTMVVLTAFLMTTLAFTVQNQKPTRRDQDAKTALAASQAGLDDYIARLNANPSYWRLGADAANPAFAAAGRTVPGTGTKGARYRYQLLSSVNDVAATGLIRIRSTGTSKGVERALTASLKPNGFLQFIYATDKETIDPLMWTTNATTTANCSRRWWEGRSSSSCSELSFQGGDTITGPLHSNDTIYITGAVTFSSPQTETSWPGAAGASKTWRTTGSYSGSPNASGYKPVYAPLYTIPSSNDDLRATAATAGTGCIYTGATSIVFTGTTMTVLSPNTTSGPAGCWDTTAADKSLPQTGKPIPSVIWVEDLSGACVKKSGSTIGVGYPLAGEYGATATTRWSSDYLGPVQGCGTGNAYIRGTLDAAVTVATTEDIIVTGDTNYLSEAAGSANVLGLIPRHFVWIYHPIATCSGSSGGCVGGYRNMLSTPVTQVDAAILAVNDSFMVMNFREGAAISTGSASTDLRVFGAIAQNFRGAVYSTDGNGGHGYLKDYVYDNRFAKGMQPPYFLQPVSAQWTAMRVSEG